MKGGRWSRNRRVATEFLEPIEDNLDLVGGRIGMHWLDAQETLPIRGNVVGGDGVRA